MKTTLIKMTLVAAIATVLATACKKDKDDPSAPQPAPNESEVITTLKLMFDDTSSADKDAVAVFDDPDGEGGNAPVRHDTIKLTANTTYLMEMIILDRTKAPADTISNEVRKEANDHQFFFHHANANVSSAYLDVDSNTPPLPLGLRTKWETGSASSGSTRIILKHQPGIKNGSEAQGETDLDVTFSIRIE
jgi:hypothetical protein